MSRFTSGAGWISFLIFLNLSLMWPSSAFMAEPEGNKTYVGPDACRECHETEYYSFISNCKKVHSYDNIKIMKKGLTEEEYKSCFECHTTGYGRPGGFVSEKETPHLRIAGCEACHGPGSLHVESQDPDDIKSKLTSEDCQTCHNSERVEAFNFKPLIFGGAH